MDLAFPDIDRRLQQVLGHFKPDFVGELSFQLLGPKFGDYGTFLPVYQHPPRFSQHEYLSRAQSCNISKLKCSPQCAKQNRVSDSFFARGPTACDTMLTGSDDLSSEKFAKQNSTDFNTKHDPMIQKPNGCERKSLKIRIKGNHAYASKSNPTSNCNSGHDDTVYALSKCNLMSKDCLPGSSSKVMPAVIPSKEEKQSYTETKSSSLVPVKENHVMESKVILKRKRKQRKKREPESLRKFVEAFTAYDRKEEKKRYKSGNVEQNAQRISDLSLKDKKTKREGMSRKKAYEKYQCAANSDTISNITGSLRRSRVRAYPSEGVALGLSEVKGFRKREAALQKVERSSKLVSSHSAVLSGDNKCQSPRDEKTAESRISAGHVGCVGDIVDGLQELLAEHALDSFEKDFLLATTTLKEATDLKHSADRLKDRSDEVEIIEIYLHAALKFLNGVYLLELYNAKSSRQGEMDRLIQIYIYTARLFEICAIASERNDEIAIAALAYKSMEVTYLRILFTLRRVPLSKQNIMQFGEESPPPGFEPGNYPLSASPKYNRCFGCNEPRLKQLHVNGEYANAAMDASWRSCCAFESATRSNTDTQRYKAEGLSSVNKAIGYSFHDVEGFLGLVRLSLHEIGV